MLATIDKEIGKRCKEVWIEEMLEAHGENVQRLVRERCPSHQTTPRVLQPWQVKMN